MQKSSCLDKLDRNKVGAQKEAEEGRMLKKKKPELQLMVSESSGNWKFGILAAKVNAQAMQWLILDHDGMTGGLVMRGKR